MYIFPYTLFLSGGKMNELQKINTAQNTSLTPGSVLPEYRSDIVLFNRWTNGRPVTADLIQKYFTHLREIGRKPTTIGRHKVSIKAAVIASRGNALTIGESAQLETFFKTIKPGTRQDAITQDATLTREELDDLTQRAGQRTSLIIRALFETAARVSELTSITLSNCKKKPAGYEITVTGKGNKEGRFFLSAALFVDIRDTFKGEVFLFETSTGKRYNRNNVNQLIKKAARYIDREDIHAHTFRHTWATLSLPTLGLPKVSKYLRHASPDTTARYYLHGQASIDEVLTNNETILRGNE